MKHLTEVLVRLSELWGLRHFSKSHTETGAQRHSSWSQPPPGSPGQDTSDKGSTSDHPLPPQNMGWGSLKLNGSGQHSPHQSWDRTQECDIPKARTRTWPFPKHFD